VKIAQWLIVVTLCAPVGARAQRPVGRADSLVAVTQPKPAFSLTRLFGGAPSCKHDRATDAPDGSVIFERGKGKVRERAKRLTQALSGDRVLVSSEALLRLRVDTGVFTPATLYFTPKLNRCPPFTDVGSRGDRAVRGIDLPDSIPGEYHLTIDSSAAAPRRGLILVVDHGVVVVRRPNTPDRTPLRVFALGREIIDVNTTFAVVVDRVAQRASAHVLDGAISIAAVPAGEGRSLLFDSSPTSAPRIQNTPPDIAADIRYYSDVVWKRPSGLGTKAKIAIGAGVVGAVAATVILLKNDDDTPSGPRRGGISVRLPI
jgi:hypothetical protein